MRRPHPLGHPMTERPANHTPLYDAICQEFARRELTDERLAELLEEWT